MKTEIILIFVICNVVGFVELQNMPDMPPCIQKYLASASSMAYGSTCSANFTEFFKELASVSTRITQELLEEVTKTGEDISTSILLRTVNEMNKLYCGINGRQVLQCQLDIMNKTCPEMRKYSASVQSELNRLMSTQGASIGPLQLLVDSLNGVDAACAEPQNFPDMPQCVREVIGSNSATRQGYYAFCASNYSDFLNEINMVPARVVLEMQPNITAHQKDINSLVMLRIRSETRKLYCRKDGREALQCQANYMNKVCPDLRPYVASVQTQLEQFLTTQAASGATLGPLQMLVDSVTEGIDAVCAASGVEQGAIVNINAIILLAVTVVKIMYH